MQTAMAIMGDLGGSRKLFGNDRKYHQCIQCLEKSLNNKNCQLNQVEMSKYVISGGDSYQASFYSIACISSFRILFPEFNFPGLDCIYKAVGIGTVSYFHENSNLCNGLHYINANEALNYAKQAYKYLGFDSIRFSAGYLPINALLDQIGLVIEDQYLYKKFSQLHKKIDLYLKKLLEAIMQWLNELHDRNIGGDNNNDLLYECEIGGLKIALNEMYDTLQETDNVVNKDKPPEALKRHLKLALARTKGLKACNKLKVPKKLLPNAI